MSVPVVLPATSASIACALHARVLTVTLSRPAALNALNRTMRDDLATVFEWCGEQRDAVRAVVLAGAGRAFCAGQDLKEGEGGATPTSSVESKRRGDFQVLLAELPQPTIAALHGYVLGRGLEVALTCDLRIGATDALLGLPEVALGMIPASGGSQRLARLVGPARALDMILSAERITGEMALAWGLVTRLVAPEALAATAQALGERLAGHAPVALRYARRAVLEGGGLSLHDGLQLEAALAAVLRTTRDREEGFRAFREKRPPRFIGE